MHCVTLRMGWGTRISARVAVYGFTPHFLFSSYFKSTYVRSRKKCKSKHSPLAFKIASVDECSLKTQVKKWKKNL